MRAEFDRRQLRQPLLLQRLVSLLRDEIEPIWRPVAPQTFEPRFLLRVWLLAFDAIERGVQPGQLPNMQR